MLGKLEQALRPGVTYAGSLASRTLDLDFALHSGVTITLDEIPADEFGALKLLHSARQKFQEEEQQNGSRSDHSR